MLEFKKLWCDLLHRTDYEDMYESLYLLAIEKFMPEEFERQMRKKEEIKKKLMYLEMTKDILAEKIGGYYE